MKLFGLLAALVLLSGSSSSAQVNLEEQASDLRKDFARPVSEWDDAFVQKTFQKYLNLYVEGLLWDPAFHSEMQAYLPEEKPHLRVDVTLELRTPYVNGNEIVIPVAYIRYLWAIGLLVGHDVYAQDHYLQLGRPLLTTPFRKSAIVPLLPHLDQAVESNAFPSAEVYLRCPPQNARCQTVEGQAFSAIILFTILHELSHELLNHRVTEEGVNVDQEIAADRNAYLVLQHCAEEFKSQEKQVREELQLSYKIAPIVWLTVEASRQGIANVVAKARREALLRQFEGDARDEIDSLIVPEHSAHNTQHLKVTSSERPELLLVDGVPFPPGEVIDKTLIVARMMHTVVATRAGEIAVATIEASNTTREISLQLVFRPLPALDLKAIEQARDHRKWVDVVFLSSAEDLQPRDSRVAFDHWKAFHRLGLDRAISVTDWNSIPSSEWSQILEWQRQGQALAIWY
jgi:hypothetical protein